jgi:isopropylmalate/homocitrate/citramalate synthase
MSLPDRVTVVEVGPRDGLQNEDSQLTVEQKVAFVEALAEAGLSVIEIGAFVHPAAVPQMATSAEVARRVRRKDGRYVALVPNLVGYRRALEAGVREVAIFTAASETFSRRNSNCSIAESLGRLREVAAQARSDGVAVRAYLSTVWHCPFEGPVPVATSERLARELLQLGAWQVSLGDTIGKATPLEVGDLLERLLEDSEPAHLALHCHDTYGVALANVLTGLQLGLSTFDASAGGLGGCPYAPGAAGNVATEDLLFLLHGMGIQTGVSMEGVVHAAALIEPALDHRLPGRAYQALRRPPAA